MSFLIRWLFLLFLLSPWTSVANAGTVFCETYFSAYKGDSREGMIIEFDVPPTACSKAKLVGPITEDTFTVVSSFLEDQPWLMYLSLNSPGGDLVESLKIGRLVHQKDLLLFIQDGEYCNSACAFIWMAGVYRYGTPNVHRPFSSSRQLAGKSIEQADTLYEKYSALVSKYLEQIGFVSLLPADFIPKMFAINPSEVRPISHLVVPSDHLYGWRPSVEQLLLETCYSLQNTDCLLKVMLEERLEN